MPKDKEKHLKDQGTLNPQAGAVKEPRFLENPFFDPQDLIQVKYEMLRTVAQDGQSVKSVAENFGVSRPTFY
ncbi:MAG: helix-turn-helix domain-containing protein, partial [bacterium]|nr:helix-turn-helix domain-containing protein [bacterium]